MSWITSVATLITVAVILYFIIQFAFRKQVAGNPRTITVVGPLQDGRTPTSQEGDIPVSDNEKEGLVFSQSGWFSVDDWMYRSGEPRYLFVKGSADGKIQCPGVFLDGTSNSMNVVLDTQDQSETIQIPNLPAQKYIHFAIVVDQVSVDIYIDGILRVHHSLRQLPRQNRSPLRVGPQGGWAGQIGSLSQHRQALTPSEIASLMASPPQDGPNTKKAMPPYLDISWYTGRY